MDDNLYDEFGVYIGPDLDDDEVMSEPEQTAFNGVDEDGDHGGSRMDIDALQSATRAVVLHEDKKYYPEAEEVYGPGVEITVQEEDTQNISEPIVKPEDRRQFVHVERTKEARADDGEGPWHATTFSKAFLRGLQDVPDLVRNVCLIGHLGHGKTVFVDALVQQTHEKKRDLERNERFMDSRFDEQERGLSIKTKPISLVLPNHKDKSFLINILDTPGHPNFLDEVSAALRLADGAILVLDVVEGVTSHTKTLLRHAAQERVDIVAVLNKMDRLITELKLPPIDAYFKIRYVLDQLNEVLESLPQLSTDSNSSPSQEADNAQQSTEPKLIPRRLSPELGNVVFASGEHGWSFTLAQFARIYGDLHQMKASAIAPFARRLWGDIFYNPETRGFSTKPPPTEPGSPLVRTFVQFVLEPLYKLYGRVIGEDAKTLSKSLAELGVSHTAAELKLDVRPLLKLTLIKFFGAHTGFVDVLEQHVLSPTLAARRKIENIWTGDLNTYLGESLLRCDPQGPLMVYVTKMYPNASRTSFYALGRVFSGTLKLGEKVKVLGETFADNDEDVRTEVVSGMYLYQTRYMVPVSSVVAGQWIALEGIDTNITKTATITTFSPSPMLSRADPDLTSLRIFAKLKVPTLSIVKIAVEPFNPSELPKLIEGLRQVNKTYPLLSTHVEESGERVILGTGELYLDSVMHDLTKVFAEIELKIAEPVTTFSETVVETSSVKCFADTPNKANRLTMIAEPLEKGLGEDIERGKVFIKLPASSHTQQGPLMNPATRSYVQQNYGWDIMAARNLWAFGPDNDGPNVLLNDTLPGEVAPASLQPVRDYIVRGFHWAAREGPLCEEPMRSVKFKILDASIASEPSQRTGTYIIPTARRVTQAAFLSATPRLMEPILAVEILTPPKVIPTIDTVLTRRRGHIVSDKELAGTPFHIMKAYIPCMDSFGFETDLRSATQGQAMCLSSFDHWAVVPGNPLDSSIQLRPLEPSPPSQLARDYMIKTRRRKGLSEDIVLSKFFDEELLSHLQSANIDLFQN
jgi:U5 small nuclear ribonucleoprotein component